MVDGDGNVGIAVVTSLTGIVVFLIVSLVCGGAGGGKGLEAKYHAALNKQTELDLTVGRLEGM